MLPIYVGFSILDLSKLVMYDIHYKSLKHNIIPSCCLHKQTVQFMELKQIMFMKIFMRIKICSILVIIHKIQSFQILFIKKVIGKMKDEFKGEITDEFVGLKSKMYSLVAADGEKIKKKKRVNKNFAKNIRQKICLRFV